MAAVKAQLRAFDPAATLVSDDRNGFHQAVLMVDHVRYGLEVLAGQALEENAAPGPSPFVSRVRTEVVRGAKLTVRARNLLDTVAGAVHLDIDGLTGDAAFDEHFFSYPKGNVHLLTRAARSALLDLRKRHVELHVEPNGVAWVKYEERPSSLSSFEGWLKREAIAALAAVREALSPSRPYR